MLVEVRPLPLRKWHGKEGKEDFSQGIILDILVDPRTRKYATGLTEEDIEMLSKKLKNIDLSDTYIPGKPHSYWSSKAAKIKLPNKTIIIDTEDPMGYIKYKNLKASKFVANSYKEWEEGNFIHATHYIYSEQEELEKKATKVAKRKQCYKILSSLTKVQKANIIQILSNKTVKHMDEDNMDVYLDDLVNEKPDEFIEIAKDDKAYLNVKAMLYEGISKNIVRTKGFAFYYMGTKIGDDLDSSVKFLTSEDGEKLRGTILSKMN